MEVIDELCLQLLQHGKLEAEHVPKSLRMMMQNNDFQEWYSLARPQDDFLEQVNDRLARSLLPPRDTIQA